MGCECMVYSAPRYAVEETRASAAIRDGDALTVSLASTHLPPADAQPVAERRKCMWQARGTSVPPQCFAHLYESKPRASGTPSNTTLINRSAYAHGTWTVRDRKIYIIDWVEAFY